MQIEQISSFTTLAYHEFKYWGPVITALWGAFKVFQWVKDLKDEDIKELRTGITDLNGKMDKQTETLLEPLRDMRNDFRAAFFQPVPVRARARKK